jgi:hypothetical protein
VELRALREKTLPATRRRCIDVYPWVSQRLDVEVMKVVHPGLMSEAVVATPADRTPRSPG